MKSPFYYSILHYVYSQALDERLNLGIIFYFPDEHRLVFKRPTSLKRLRTTYPTIETTVFIETTLEFMEDMTNEAEPKWFKDWHGSTLKRIIDRYILKHDSSALQFGETKTVLKYSDDLDKVVNDFYDLYFPSNLWV